MKKPQPQPANKTVARMATLAASIPASQAVNPARRDAMVQHIAAVAAEWAAATGTTVPVPETTLDDGGILRSLSALENAVLYDDDGVDQKLAPYRREQFGAWLETAVLEWRIALGHKLPEPPRPLGNTSPTTYGDVYSGSVCNRGRGSMT